MFDGCIENIAFKSVNLFSVLLLIFLDNREFSSLGTDGMIVEVIPGGGD